jgi:hypothetical protein
MYKNIYNKQKFRVRGKLKWFTFKSEKRCIHVYLKELLGI